MSSTKIYDYSVEGDYNFNPTDIEIVSEEAKLKLQTLAGQNFAEPFTSDTGFTYDSAKSEWPGTQVQQIDLLGGASLAAPFTVDEDATSGDGDLTGTLVNGATVTGGKLDLTGGSTKYLSYDATGKINATKGSIKWKYTHQVIGAPGTNEILFRFSNGLGSNNNDLYVYHDTANAFRMTSKTAAGAAVNTAQPFGSKVLTQFQEYEMSYNWDYENGEHRMFIDQVQQGGTLGTVSVLRSDDLTSVAYLGIGDVAYSDGIFDDVVVYPLVKYTTAPPTYEIPAFRYAEDYVLSPLEVFAGSPDGALQSVSAFTPTGSAGVKFTFNLADGTAYWWNGSAWALSSSTYATSNTSAEILANLLTFNFSSGTTQLRYGVTFENSNSVMNYIDNLSIDYTHQIYSTNDDVISPSTSTRMWTEDFTSFAESVTLGTANTAVQYIMNVNGTKTYWSGSAWVASSNNWATSNTQADITANIGTLISARTQIGFDSLLRSTDGLYTPKVNSNTFVFDEALPDATPPRSVDINGYLYVGDVPLSGQIVECRPYQNGFNNPGSGVSGVYNVRNWQTIGTSVSDGFFSGSTLLQPLGKFWEFRINRDKVYTQLPDQDAVDFSTLTLIPSEES